MQFLPLKFVFDALSVSAGFDQAANLCEVLAWSYLLKLVLRTANTFDVFTGNPMPNGR
jgi:hypothetical protein